MAEVKIRTFNVYEHTAECELEIAEWVNKGWQIVGTAFHGHFSDKVLWVIFQKDDVDVPTT